MPNDYPFGAVMSFAGNVDPGSGWLRCDGRSVSRASYGDLFTAIGTSNGGDGNNFNLPDLRGRFLRGRDGGTGRDPEAASRGAAAVGGATGDLVGSLQQGATAKPNSGFSTQVSRLPTESRSVAATAVGHTLAKWNSGSRTINPGLSGGDAETRPANIALRFFIYAGA